MKAGTVIHRYRFSPNTETARRRKRRGKHRHAKNTKQRPCRHPDKGTTTEKGEKCSRQQPGPADHQPKIIETYTAERFDVGLNGPDTRQRGSKKFGPKQGYPGIKKQPVLQIDITIRHPTAQHFIQWAQEFTFMKKIHPAIAGQV